MGEFDQGALCCELCSEAEAATVKETSNMIENKNRWCTGGKKPAFRGQNILLLVKNRQ